MNLETIKIEVLSIMNPKAIALLSFLQALVITLSMMAANICYLPASNYYDYLVREKYYSEIAQASVKFGFHTAVQQYALNFYLIPILWFIFALYFNTRVSPPRFITRITMLSAIT